MSNAFVKEIQVAFDELCLGFEDALIMSKQIAKYPTDQTMMARTNDIIWRPMPYIARSYDGLDQTANFKPQTQLSVPATIGFKKSSPWIMNALELRDALQEKRLFTAAKQKLSSDINLAIMRTAAMQGTMVVARSGAPGTYADVAAVDTLMRQQGVPDFERTLALSAASYNGMADNLQVASRSFGNSKSDKAYERSYVGPVAGIDTFKLDYANRIRAASWTGTIDTRASAGNYYVPQAYTVSNTGELSPVDNRYQVVTVSSTTGMAAGDAFTIDGVFAVHHITKESTGALKTFRIISVQTGTTAVISPPIISAQGLSNAELQYQNVIVDGAGSATAAINELNIAAADINPFWQRDALEILPGRLAVESDVGMSVMRATTENGIEIVFTRQGAVDNLETKYRVDVLFGVVNKQPEMSGILLFNQA